MYFINYDSLFNDTIINEGDLHMIPEDIINILTDKLSLIQNISIECLNCGYKWQN